MQYLRERVLFGAKLSKHAQSRPGGLRAANLGELVDDGAAVLHIQAQPRQSWRHAFVVFLCCQKIAAIAIATAGLGVHTTQPREHSREEPQILFRHVLIGTQRAGMVLSGFA